MAEGRSTTAERLARIETILIHYEKEILSNGVKAGEGLESVINQLKEMDTKWDQRFEKLEAEQRKTFNDFEKFKSRGAGILTALGVVFTATATIFSSFFSAVKHAITG